MRLFVNWCLGLLLCFPLPVAFADEPPHPLPPGLHTQPPSIPDTVTGAIREFNVQTSRDLQPTDNLAVVLVQFYGDQAFEPELRETSLQMLGIAGLAPSTPRFVYLENYIRSLRKVPLEQISGEALRLQDELFTASEDAWTAEDFPDVEGYLKANAEGLDFVSRLARGRRYFAPMLSAEVPPRLMSPSLVIERRLPFLARCLAARALRSAKRNHFNAAIDDILTAHRLGSQLAIGSPLDVSLGKANVMDAIAFRAEVALLQLGTCDLDNLRRLQTSLSEIPLLTGSARAADMGERAILHQEIELIRDHEQPFHDYFGLPADQELTPAQQTLMKELDWAAVLKRADELQDQLVKALATTDLEAQNRQFDDLDQQYQTWEKDAATVEAAVKKGDAIDTARMNRSIGEMMMVALKPFYRQRRITEDRATARRELTLVAIGLLAHYHQQQQFPLQLTDITSADLDRKLLQTKPFDQFRYDRLADRHVKLVHFGGNRQDDSGQAFNDDLVIDFLLGSD